MLQDILNDSLTEDNKRVIIRQLFDHQTHEFTTTSGPSSLQTPGQAKSLEEFYDLVRRAINDYETRAGTPAANKVHFTEEDPGGRDLTEAITFNLVKRVPGAFAQGAPFEAGVKNLRPILREKRIDPANPTYQAAVMGYWHDNLVRFTCWAKTNKAANKRAAWFEAMMEEYAWWFRMQGVSRVLFWGRHEDKYVVADDNKWYGRPLEFFVKTETIRVLSEKTLEEIIVNLSVNAGSI